MQIRIRHASIESSMPFFMASRISSQSNPRYSAIKPEITQPMSMGICGSVPSPTTQPNITAASRPKASIPWRNFASFFVFSAIMPTPIPLEQGTTKRGRTPFSRTPLSLISLICSPRNERLLGRMNASAHRADRSNPKANLRNAAQASARKQARAHSRSPACNSAYFTSRIIPITVSST